MNLKSFLAFFGLLLAGVHYGNASTVEDQMRDLQLRLEQMFEEQGEQIKQMAVEIIQLRQTVERLSGIVVNVDQSMKIVEGNHDIVMRNLTHVTSQSDEIMMNQQFCANHDRLRDLYFELLPRCEDPTVPPVTTQAPPPTTPEDPNVYESCAHAPSTSGVYNLVLRDNIVFRGYCEQNLRDGGWLVFQTRFDGSVDFNRSWIEYRDGFGDPTGEHWLGLRYLNQLTLRHAELLIDMEDYALHTEFAYYSGFRVDNEPNYYFINFIGDYFGTAGDSFSGQVVESFGTYDNSHPSSDHAECAKTWASGYWHHGCSSPSGRNNLNGIYGIGQGERGIWWGSFGGGSPNFFPLKYVKMMIRY